MLQAANESSWETAFPQQTEVRDHSKPTVTDATWKTFPANQMPDHAVDAHQTSLCAYPVSRPTASGSPLATEVLNVFARIEGLRDLIGALQNYEQSRSDYLVGIGEARTAAAQAAVTPGKPAPGQGGGPAVGGGQPKAGERAAAPPPHRSAIAMLHEHDDLDSQVDTYLDGYTDGTRPATEPTEKMLRDVHLTRGYYWRPEEQTPPAPDRDAPADVQQASDFHARVSAAGNVPALLRALGLVVDVKVDAAALATLTQATRIWCEVTVGGVETYAVPKTICAVDGDRFHAVPSDADRWGGGLLRVGNVDHYAVLDLDPDAAGLALEQLLRSAVRARAVEANGDAGSFSPPALRSTGFVVAEIDRPNRLKPQVQTAEKAQQDADTPGATARGLQLRGSAARAAGRGVGRRHQLLAQFARAHGHRVLRRRTDSRRRARHRAAAEPTHEQGARRRPEPLLRPRGACRLGRLEPVGAASVERGLGSGRHAGPGRERARTPEHDRRGSTCGPWSGRDRCPHCGTAANIPSASPVWIWPATACDLHPATSTPLAGPDRFRRRASRYLAGPRCRARCGDADLDTEQEWRVAAGAARRPRRSAMPRSSEPWPRCFNTRDHSACAQSWPSPRTTRRPVRRRRRRPTTASAPRTFLRWDPITSPTLVPRSAYVTGESVQRMVIRPGMTGPGVVPTSRRAPKGSELEAEQDGRLDELMRQAIALERTRLR